MAAANMELLIDRLLSASTPSDCLDSLTALQTACQSPDAHAAVDAIVQNLPVLRALCHLIGSSTLPSMDDNDIMKVEGGDIGATELLLTLLPDDTPNMPSTAVTSQDLQSQRIHTRRKESLSKSLMHFHQQPTDNLQEVAFIPSLLDCLCSSSTTTYARVLSIQILSNLLSYSPGSLREQLMQAPDGINRLVDLLGYSPNDNTNEGEVPEEVRNASILLLTKLASSSSVLARLITFSEGYSRALSICLESKGDDPVSIDCLELCVALASQDEVARELFLGGGDAGNLTRLGMLMDLRRGERFCSVERNLWWREEWRRKRTEKNEKSLEEKKKKRGKRKDDLDDILSGAEVVSKTDGSKANVHPSSVGPPVPYLTPNESSILDRIFNLLLVVLYDGESPTSRIAEASAAKRRVRAKEIVMHNLLTRSIVDCALYTLPPPGVDYVSAVPPPELQRKALMVMAVLGSLGDTLDCGGRNIEEETKLQTHLLFEVMPLYLQGRVTAMERLMYLGCTGAYRSQNEEDDCPEATASLISLNAIAAFRSCLPADTACRMVLHALAPPPPDEAEEEVAPLEMPVVTKLVTTLVENLRFLQSNQQAAMEGGDEFDMTAIYGATVGASGAAGALGVLLTKGEGDATREMLLRMVPPPPSPLEPEEAGAGMSEPISSSNLIDFVLQFIASYDHSGQSQQDDQSVGSKFQKSVAYVTLSLLRILAEWIEGMPKAVSEILSSPSSVSLGVLVRSKSSSAVPAMSGLLLGLCLDSIADKGSSNSLTNVETSAWTRETIINMIQSMGVAKYFSMIDEWNKKPFPLPYCSGDEGPVLEQRTANAWYSQSVTKVRRRIVATLAGDSGENEVDSEGEDEHGVESNASTRSLRKIVKSQANEMEELQSKLEEAMLTIDSQCAQIKSLKRVAELGTSAETNDMLSEYADKITELEKEKVHMMNEAETQSNRQKEEMSSKDQEIASLKEDLRQARIAAEESERDKENLSEAMASLSAAYNSLEQEYHRSSSFNSANEGREMTAGGETAIEGGGATSVPGGETAVEDPARANHQLQILLDENARLQEDVRAAQEWMTMAVSKMDEMGRENESLSTSLQEAQNQTTVLPSYLKEKDEELAQQKITIQDLHSRNEEAQQWMDSAVNRLDALTNEVELLKSRNSELEASINESTAIQPELEEAKAQNKTLQDNLAEFQAWTETAQARLAEMEVALQEMTKERDELKMLQASPEDTNKQQVESLRIELDKKAGELNDVKTQLEQVQSQIKESDANDATVETLRNQLDEQSQLVESLTSERNELLARASTKQADSSETRVIELEAAIQEITSERDELKQSLQSSAVGIDVQLGSLQAELKMKTEELDDAKSQLEQVQSQLIEESDANEEAIENLNNTLDTLKQENKELLANVDLAQNESANLSGQIETLNQRIIELEAAKKMAECQAEDLMKLSAPDSTNLEDEIIAITADRNEIKSHFDDLTEEYEQTRQTLERVQMENGNLLARNRALEQDNKSLEYQFTEASSKSAESVQLHSRITELEMVINSLQQEKTALQEALDCNQNASKEAVTLWKERVEALESQLKEQEEEAVEAIAQWEARCSSLEGSGEVVIQQWEERAQALESEITALENQVTTLSDQNNSLQNSLTESSQRMQTEIREKDEAIASYDEQIDLLTKELLAAREESEQVVEQWQVRVEELETTINDLNVSLGNQQVEATDAISQWEARCVELNEKIEELEVQLTSTDPVAEKLQMNLSTANENLLGKEKELDRLTAELRSLQMTEAQKETQISSLLSELEDTRSKLDRSSAEYELLRQTLAHKESEHSDQVKHLKLENERALHASKDILDGLNARLEELQSSLAEANNKLALKDKEWAKKENLLAERIVEVETSQATSSQSSEALQREFNSLKEKYQTLEHEKSQLESKRNEAMRDAEESIILVNELTEELRCTQEELQSYATDQLSARANEIASHALRESMLEVRSQYEADRKALAVEKELRLAAETEVDKLKMDLALLSQATEYDDTVDIQVRKIAKKMSAKNTRKERQEMEELRSALEQLKEELGTCRWKEREAEEKAANARLQKSILEQEVCAAKSDMALMEQAIEDLETSKIDISVSMEYRIETLLNERTSLDKSYQEEFAAIKAQLAKVNQEKDNLVHRLEQSEKANAALTLGTISGEERGESEVVRLQLERAQLLAKITEIGVDSERRVREAVAAHASSAEAELIIEKQAKQLTECSLADALSELEDVKSQLMDKSCSEVNSENDVIVTELRESLAEMQISYRELQTANEELKKEMADASLQSQSRIESLSKKLRKAETRVREEEREKRFEFALASEIARLQSGVASQHTHSMKADMVVTPEMESISENVLAMHEYVVDLLKSRDEEREQYKAMEVELNEALALLGQSYQDEMNFSVSE